MTTYKIKDNIQIEYSDKSAVLLDGEGNRFFYIGDIEKNLLKELETENVESLISKFEILYSNKNVRKDINSFLEKLIELEILQKIEVN